MVKVELVYIAQNQQAFQQRLEMAPGATVADAILKSGIHQTHPETKELAVGIFAKIVNLETVLKEGDRVEFYRPLLRDPKEKRRLQARKVKK